MEDLLAKKNLLSEYEKDTLSYTLHLNYKPDWTIKYKDGTIYLEAKGLLDYETRRKMVQVKREHPEKDIRIIFMRNQKVRKGSPTTYVEWATKNGFPCSVYPELPL